MFKTNNKKGFTIIELIVIIAVIGVLVLLAMPKFMGHTQQAKFTKFISNTKQIETASERYYVDKNDWPRLSDTPYTADQITAFSQKIYDATGNSVTLDPTGNYYDIDYNKLSQYVKVPDDNLNYVIQNPVGNVYALESITQEATVRLETGSVLLNKSTLSLNVGESSTLVATVMPTTSVNKNVIWTSSNTSIATIDNTGKITAIGNGTTTITVKTENGGYIETCTVTVTTLVTGITLNTSSTSVNAGSTVQLTATILPSTATIKNVTWISSNTAVATVSSSGVITTISTGTSTITAKTVDGNYTANCNVSVTVILLGTLNFTNAGAVGANGPTQSQLTTAYTSTTLAGKVTTTNGMQLWTVPQTGVYRIAAYGSKGGSDQYAGGLGSIMTGEFSLIQGQVLSIKVGQQGLITPSHGASGGGGTGVKINTNILIVAGAGGGSGYFNAGVNASTSTSGTSGQIAATNGSSGAGGTNGDGGQGGFQTGDWTHATGGGGALSNGGVIRNVTTGATGGYSEINGGGGGITDNGNGSNGGFGFGGGGCTRGYSGGGGGGYSGGGGGGGNYPGGGGGGSYNSGANQSNTVGNSGNGKVIITQIS